MVMAVTNTMRSAPLPINTKEPKIPQNWDMKPLSVYVIKHNSGIYKNQKYYGYGENIVGVSDFVSVTKIDGQDFARVPLNEDEKRKYTLREGDLLYCESSLVREGIARTIHVTKNGEGTAFAWHTRRYCVDRRKIHPGYLSYFFQSSMARSYLVNNSIQTALTGINTRAYFDCPILFPPLEEQKAIAEALSDADALIEGLEKLIAKKRLIKQGAMQELLTGKRRLPGFSGEWKTVRLSEIAEICSGGTPSTARPDFWDGSVLWCTPTDITALGGNKYLRDTSRKITEAGLKGSSAEVIPARSVVMTSRATIGECAINELPVTTNQGFKNLVPRAEAHVEFLYYFMTTQKERLIALCGGSTFLEIGKTQLTSFEITIPETKAEQVAISMILAAMDSELETLVLRLAKARQIKQGMMQELLTGRIRLV